MACECIEGVGSWALRTLFSDTCYTSYQPFTLAVGTLCQELCQQNERQRAKANIFNFHPIPFQLTFKTIQSEEALFIFTQSFFPSEFFGPHGNIEDLCKTGSLKGPT